MKSCFLQYFTCLLGRNEGYWDGLQGKWSYMAGGRLMACVDHLALEPSFLGFHTLCLECRCNLEGIVVLPGWNIAICVKILVLSCHHTVFSTDVLCLQRQTGSDDVSRNTLLPVAAGWNLRMFYFQKVLVDTISVTSSV